jgi:hypothetical protein
MAHRLYAQVAERADHLCEYCQAPEDVFNQEFEVDHIVSRAQQGCDHLHNLALACQSCNRRKSKHGAARDPETGESALLFHPRQGVWDEHFVLDLDTFFIEGQTPTGRATVLQLGLNRRKQVRARAVWFTLATTDD